jgi:hypothetical protein
MTGCTAMGALLVYLTAATPPVVASRAAIGCLRAAKFGWSSAKHSHPIPSQGDVWRLGRVAAAGGDERLKMVCASAGPAAALHEQEQGRRGRRSAAQRSMRQEEQRRAGASVLAMCLHLQRSGGR